MITLTTYRPSAPEVQSFFASHPGLVLAGTGHRPDKLGGYGNGKASDRPVRRFAGTPFSNFAPCEVEYDGQVFPSVEHAYQAAKTLNRDERTRIQRLATPGQAKAAGKHVRLRGDWDKIRVPVMRHLLTQKFSQPHYAQALAATSGMLEEGNSWGDRFWGTVDGVGANNLGVLLMDIRKNLTLTARNPFADLVEIATAQLREIRPAVVISGMALGWDTALAYAAMECQIPLVAAVPFPGQARRWQEHDQKRWQYLLGRADLIVTVGSDELAEADVRAAMNWRNEFMIDRAQLILACWDGSSGGTANAVRYAEETGKPVINTYHRWQLLTGRVTPAQPTTRQRPSCWVKYPATHLPSGYPAGWMQGEIISEQRLPGRFKGQHQEFEHVYVVNVLVAGKLTGSVVPTSWVTTTPPTEDSTEDARDGAETECSCTPTGTEDANSEAPSGEAPAEARIVSVRFTSAPSGPRVYGDTRVVARFDTGHESSVLDYYSDELQFSPHEFTGLTREQVGALFHRKDVAYLQS